MAENRSRPLLRTHIRGSYLAVMSKLKMIPEETRDAPMNKSRAICGILSLIVCLAAAPGLAQDTPVYGDAQEMAYEGYLRQVLQTPLTVNFKETPLSDVLAHVEKQLGLQMVVDYRALEELGITTDSEVSFECEKLAARDVLELILEGNDLSWVNKQVLFITTKEKADTHVVVRIYPVADIVTITNGDKGTTWLDYDSLSEVIQTTIAPSTWEEVGGPGSIAALPGSGAIVFNQTREVHEQVEWLLRSLRDARDAQGLPVYDFRLALKQDRLRTLEFEQASQVQLQALQQAAPRGPVVVEPWQLPRSHE